MTPSKTDTTESVYMHVDPGVCGFVCRITARKNGKRMVKITITGSECPQIQKLSRTVTELTLKEVFLPITRNPVYRAAEQSGCHPSCGIPLAIVKTAEVAMDMALPRNVTLRFDEGEKDPRHADE